MTNFHDYSQFVNAAYGATAILLLVLAIFFLLQLKQNETAFKKNQSKKTAKN